MLITLVILVASVVFFIQGKIRSDLVALSALLLLVLFGILTPTEALSGFSSPIVIMLVGVFIVGGAVFRTGLAKLLSQKILSLAGNSQTKLFILIMLATAGIGAFVSNTGTVAVMLPIVVSLAAGAHSSPSRFLMPLAFASTMGGMLTLIGTTPNLIINDALINAGYGALNFFAFLPIGLVCVTVGTIVLIFLSKWLLDKKPDEENSGRQSILSLRELADKYHLEENVYIARVMPESPFSGHSLLDLDIGGKFGTRIIEIRRKFEKKRLFQQPVDIILPLPETELHSGDIIKFVTPEARLSVFTEQNNLQLLDPEDTESGLNPQFKYRFDAIGLAELVILASSRLVNKQVKESGLRNTYGVNVIGIQRGKETLLQDIKTVKIQPGDALLVQGEWGSINRLDSEPSEWVVVGRPSEAASSEPLMHKAPVAALIVLFMIVAMAFNILQPVIAVMLAALALVFTGCFSNPEEAYKTIKWESTVLVAAMLPMSVALEKTGAATLASTALIEAVGGFGPYALMAGIYAVTSVVTLLVSNTATAAICTPIAMQAAMNMNLSPYPFLFAVATAASMSLASPFSTPPNVLVMSPGRYVFMDYVKVGGPLQILFGLIMVFFLPLIFPFAK